MVCSPSHKKKKPAEDLQRIWLKPQGQCYEHVTLHAYSEHVQLSVLQLLAVFSTEETQAVYFSVICNWDVTFCAPLVACMFNWIYISWLKCYCHLACMVEWGYFWFGSGSWNVAIFVLKAGWFGGMYFHIEVTFVLWEESNGEEIGKKTHPMPNPFPSKNLCCVCVYLALHSTRGENE